MNVLLNSAKEMGLIDRGYNNNMPNSTKCATLKDIRDSHFRGGRNTAVIVKMNNIYGMLILFGLGIGASLFILGVECVMKVRVNSIISLMTFFFLTYEFDQTL